MMGVEDWLVALQVLDRCCLRFWSSLQLPCCGLVIIVYTFLAYSMCVYNSYLLMHVCISTKQQPQIILKPCGGEDRCA